MTTRKNRSLGIVAATLAVLLVANAAFAQCCARSSKATKDIVDVAQSAGQFNTLVAAVKAAGLVEALKGEGPLTVFAPTDEAFAKLPAGTIESLLKPENRSRLQAILTYHVVAGKLDAAHVVKSSSATTLNGQRIDFKTEGDTVMVDQARVVATDIMATNGIIHVIDSVILPSSDNIVQTASSAKIFETLLTAATKAGLAEALAGDGPFTVFAPTDEAFAKLPEGTIASLLRPENRAQLANILKYHVVQGRVYADAAVLAGQADTLAGQKIKVSNGGGSVMINDAHVVLADLDASNGVIHVIDKVILPKS